LRKNPVGPSENYKLQDPLQLIHGGVKTPLVAASAQLGASPFEALNEEKREDAAKLELQNFMATGRRKGKGKKRKFSKDGRNAPIFEAHNGRGKKASCPWEKYLRVLKK